MDHWDIVAIAAIIWAITVAYIISIKFLKYIIMVMQSESKVWREAYVAKEYGSTVFNSNAKSGIEYSEKQSDLEQSDKSVVETGAQAEDYAHLVSKTAKTAVSFGEDVSS